MKRNIFVLFVITMIAICISSCSNSFDVSSNRISEIETRNVQRTVIQVKYGEDWENPETGEYVRWDKISLLRGSTARYFSFSIRYSFTVSDIPISTSNINVYSSADVISQSGGPLDQDYTGREYTVEVGNWFSSTATFAVGGSSGPVTLTGYNPGSGHWATVSVGGIYAPYLLTEYVSIENR